MIHQICLQILSKEYFSAGTGLFSPIWTTECRNVEFVGSSIWTGKQVVWVYIRQCQIQCIQVNRQLSLSKARGNPQPLTLLPPPPTSFSSYFFCSSSFSSSCLLILPLRHHNILAVSPSISSFSSSPPAITLTLVFQFAFLSPTKHLLSLLGPPFGVRGWPPS